MSTVRDALLARASDDRPALLAGAERWSWREYVGQCARRAHVLADLLADDRPPHVGLLMDNTPEMAFQLGAAGLGGHVAVGLNTTRRGESLLADIRKADCQVIVADPRLLPLLEGIDLAGVRLERSDDPSWQQRVDAAPDLAPEAAPEPGSLFMLIFTSGTSGDPKAVRITHEKVTFPGAYLVERLGLGPDDVFYASMPLFHSNAVMAAWGPALVCGGCVALAERFSASGFLSDVRRYGATYMNYVGKPLSYVLATPARPDDADNPLRLAFGNEAGDRDIAAFSERFGCRVVDGFGSTENAVVISRIEGTPPGSLGMPLEGVAVLDPETAAGVPTGGLRRHRPGGQPRRGDRRAGQHGRDRTVRRLLQRRGGDGRADARRHVLEWRPRLPRRGRLRLLRRPHRRLAAGGRREPRGRPDRAHPRPAPVDRRGSGVRRTRPVVGRPARGSARAGRVARTRGARGVPGRRSPTSARSSGRGTSGSSTHSPAPRPTRCSSGTSGPRDSAVARRGKGRSEARRT